MRKTVCSNRRITYRDNFNIIGSIKILFDNRTFEQKVHIVNISFDGMEIVFSDDDFLNEYLSFLDSKDNTVLIEFDVNEKKYSFNNCIKWFRLYNIGERNYYVLSGLNYLNIENYKNDLVELIMLLQMQNIYLG
ncbi:MAG: hypothetical protein JXB50_06225 [Spirochaetes bacterium]|nr:hypothetical protein [Spirochaetota bacterium]